jgi:hypothetical protein
VRRLLHTKMLESLFQLHKYLDWIQGTSPNENFHSYLRAHLVISGGGRGYNLLWIFLCIVAKRFNEGVQRNVHKKRRHASIVGSAMAAALRRGVAPAAGARRERALRTAWHAYMDVERTLETLEAEGFKRRKAEVGPTLGDQELEQLYQGFLRLVADEEVIHTQDPYYYIAHHIAERTLTPFEVQQLLKIIEKRIAAGEGDATAASEPVRPATATD